MNARFESFVILAGMRTGSNFLEANLNKLEGVCCHGEAFNPHFIGYPNRTELLGMDQKTRDDDPLKLLERIRSQADYLGGFRFFHDHDPRVLPRLLEDAGCAKIVLTRNPVETYVSWKIAQSTDQWKLTNVARRKKGRAHFEAQEFETHVAQQQDFQLRILNTLQKSGQTAFYIGYDDLGDIDVLNGLASWLGVSARLSETDSKMKRQNPQPLSENVENFAQMEAELARFDRFDLSRVPNAEPRRGPVVPGYVAAAHAPLLFAPIRSGPERNVLDWLAALDGVGQDALLGNFSQKSLRQWLRHHSGHRRFTVLRHPVSRAHTAFCDKILRTEGPGTYKLIRRKLVNRHGLPLPDDGPDCSSYDVDAHRATFKAFLAFLRENLAQQTNLRIDAHWCSQSAAIQGMAEFAMPDMLVREEDMSAYLPALAMEAGYDAAPEPGADRSVHTFELEHVYDDEIETLTRGAYQRDYINFGFANWA